MSHDKTVIQQQIAVTDQQINKLVYELYGLSEDEIKVVEGKPTDGSEPEPILVNTPATSYN